MKNRRLDRGNTDEDAIHPPGRLTHLNFGAYHLRLALLTGTPPEGCVPTSLKWTYFRAMQFQPSFEVTYGQEKAGRFQEAAGDAAAGFEPHCKPHAKRRALGGRGYGAGHCRPRRQLLYQGISVQPEQ